MGIVIAKSINVYGVTESQASVLEAFKDLPIAVVSFLVASFLPRFGYKKAITGSDKYQLLIVIKFLYIRLLIE